MRTPRPTPAGLSMHRGGALATAPLAQRFQSHPPTLRPWGPGLAGALGLLGLLAGLALPTNAARPGATSPHDAGPGGAQPLATSGQAARPTAADLRAACDAPDWATVRWPEQHPVAHARAHWLDGQRIQWPGQPAQGVRYLLAAGADGLLRAEPGQPLQGAQHSRPLAVDTRPLPAALATRFGHLSAGVRLRLPPLRANEQQALWQGAQLLLALDKDGRVLQATRLQLPGALDARHARWAARDDGPALGVQVNPGRPGQPAHTAWRLWAPTARAVHVCLYPSARGPASGVHALRPDPISGMWQGGLPQDLSHQHYTLLVDVWVPGTGQVLQRVTDPYALSLSGDSQRTWIGRLDDPRTQPAGWASAPRPSAPAEAVDLSVYELHVRDFSLNDERVPAALRGKYLAFQQADSHGMRHLRALARAGLTDVHLLPVFDLATVPERDCSTPAVPAAAADSPLQQAAVAAAAAQDCFNWGYDPLHFNAPEGSFALDPDDGAARLREFRAMVMGLNAAGLRVGMDVVYNHFSASGQHRHSVLDRIVPGYYVRLNAEGVVERSTCCDNSATEHAMMGRLMRDSVRLWARWHRIDGFRFDLMGHQPRSEMLRLKALLARDNRRTIALIGEGWNFGEVADGARFVQASQLSLAGSGIGTFSDRARDALRGGGVGDDAPALVRRQGLLNGLGTAPNEAVVPPNDPAALAAYLQQQRPALLAAKDLVRLGLAGTLRSMPVPQADGRVLRGDAMRYGGQIAGYAQAPGEVVNYVENHDNHTLWDVNLFKLPLATSAQERTRVQVLGIALTALSQGVPYFHAGMERLRSKSMDGNSYDSGDWFNRLDFSPDGDNGFARGLPPARDNQAAWAQIGERLRRPEGHATPAQIRQASQALQDWLAVRASSPAWRLRTAAEVERRLQFLDTGPEQQAGLLAWTLDASDLPGSGHRRLLAAVNLAPQPVQFSWPAAVGQAWRLHPTLAAPQAADERLRHEARHEPATGQFSLPGRSAVVWVLD